MINFSDKRFSFVKANETSMSDFGEIHCDITERLLLPTYIKKVEIVVCDWLDQYEIDDYNSNKEASYLFSVLKDFEESYLNTDSLSDNSIKHHDKNVIITFIDGAIMKITSSEWGCVSFLIK